MIEPLISVIIPVYNVEKYLRQCLDSVLKQTYTNYEAILVDDGSTDNSSKICDEYCQKDDRFRVIHCENGGLSVARNTGLDDANGEYIYFLDSDDWIEDTTLEELTLQAAKTKADFVFFEGKSFEDSEKGYNIKQGYQRKIDYAVGTGIELFDELQNHFEMHFPVQMYFYRKKFLTDNQLNFYPGILYEDVIFTFEAFCKSKLVAHCHKELYHRRFREGSIVTTKPRTTNFESACVSLEEVIRIANDTGYANRSTVVRYIIRVAMRPLDIYSQLSTNDKVAVHNRYNEIVSKIRKAKGFGDKALYNRTYGKIPWAVYKAVQKITRR